MLVRWALEPSVENVDPQLSRAIEDHMTLLSGVDGKHLPIKAKRRA